MNQPGKNTSVTDVLKQALKYGAYAVVIFDTLKFVSDRLSQMEAEMEKKTDKGVEEEAAD